jgi:hypothetical protein
MPAAYYIIQDSVRELLISNVSAQQHTSFSVEINWLRVALGISRGCVFCCVKFILNL